jgi:hypothetical protein
MNKKRTAMAMRMAIDRAAAHSVDNNQPSSTALSSYIGNQQS